MKGWRAGKNDVLGWGQTLKQTAVLVYCNKENKTGGKDSKQSRAPTYGLSVLAIKSASKRKSQQVLHRTVREQVTGSGLMDTRAADRTKSH